jgi:microcystin-dependent protein
VATLTGNIKGPPGAQGPQGPQGVDGATGVPGPAGPTGPTGPNGPTGPVGPFGGKEQFRGLWDQIGPVGDPGRFITNPSARTLEISPRDVGSVDRTSDLSGIAVGDWVVITPQTPQPWGSWWAAPISAVGKSGSNFLYTFAVFPIGDIPIWPETPRRASVAFFRAVKGDTGAQGPAGVQGPAGADSTVPGPQGPQGPKGDTGATGAQGPQGVKGDTGLQGPKGDTGTQGPVGATGSQGPTGATGSQGPKGPNGIAGLHGGKNLFTQYWNRTLNATPASGEYYIVIGQVTLSNFDANGTNWSASLAGVVVGDILQLSGMSSSLNLNANITAITVGASTTSITYSAIDGTYPNVEQTRVSFIRPLAGQGVAPGGTAGQVLTKVDGTDYHTAWVTPPAPAGVPVGSMVMYGKNGAFPEGWLKCDGSTLSRVLYPELFAVIGGQYGAGDGTTTFLLPNFSGSRVPAHAAPGSVGGAATHTHTDPSHTHTVPAHAHPLSGAGIAKIGLYASAPQIVMYRQTAPVSWTSSHGISGTANAASSTGSIGSGAALDGATDNSSVLTTGGAALTTDPADSYPPYLGVIFIIKAVP